MPLKVSIHCLKCGQTLCKKIIPGRRGASENLGLEIICPNCRQMNCVGVGDVGNQPDEPIGKIQGQQPYGERVRFSRKEIDKLPPGGAM